MFRSIWRSRLASLDPPQSIDFRWRIEAGRRGALGLARGGRGGGRAGLATRPGRTAATIQVRYSHRHEMFPVQDSGRQALDAGMGKREAIKPGESHGIP